MKYKEFPVILAYVGVLVSVVVASAARRPPVAHTYTQLHTDVHTSLNRRTHLQRRAHVVSTLYHGAMGASDV